MAAENQLPMTVLQTVALRIAKQCRFQVQACLRPEEFHLADETFHDIILRALVELEDRRQLPAYRGER